MSAETIIWGAFGFFLGMLLGWLLRNDEEELTHKQVDEIACRTHHHIHTNLGVILGAPKKDASCKECEEESYV